jgi:hypothetical protein
VLSVECSTLSVESQVLGAGRNLDQTRSHLLRSQLPSKMRPHSTSFQAKPSSDTVAVYDLTYVFDRFRPCVENPKIVVTSPACLVVRVQASGGS